MVAGAQAAKGATRAQFGSALCAAMQARADAVRVGVIVAWCMIEGQEARENDPLAAWNTNYPHPPGQSSNKFSYDTIDHAVVDSAARMAAGKVYGSIGNAFRNPSSTAQQLIDAIQRAGWCGGPGAPCPAYGSGISSNYRRITKDATSWAAAANVACATTSLSAGLTDISLGPITVPLPGPNITLPDPLGGVGTAVGAAGSAVEIFGKLAANLISPAWWKRVGIFVLGVWILLAGLFVVFRDSSPVNALQEIPKHAAEAAATAAVVA